MAHGQGTTSVVRLSGRGRGGSRFFGTVRSVAMLAGGRRTIPPPGQVPSAHPKSVLPMVGSGQEHWPQQESIARKGYVPPGK